MIVFLQSLLAAVHLATVGLAAVGPLLVAGFRLVPNPRRGQIDLALYRVAGWSIAAVLVAAITGLAAGMWRAWTGDGAYLAMLERFPHRAYGMLAGEWLFTLLCYGGWMALWKRWHDKPWRHAVLAFIGATNLLYHFPPLMIAHNLLAEQPELVQPAVITRDLMLGVMYLPQVVAKTIHFWGAAVVVAATALVLASRELQAPEGRLAVVRWSAIAGLLATTAQFISGMLTLLLLPVADTRNLTGGSLLATSLLVFVVLLSIHLLMHWARLALRPPVEAPIAGLSAVVACIMLTMSLIARS